MIDIGSPHLEKAGGAVRMLDKREDAERAFVVVLAIRDDVARAPAQEGGAGKAPKRRNHQHAGRSLGRRLPSCRSSRTLRRPTSRRAFHASPERAVPPCTGSSESSFASDRCLAPRPDWRDAAHSCSWSRESSASGQRSGKDRKSV